MIKKLNNSTVQRPSHKCQVLQFGEGNFLRAFADWMIDVANEKGITDTSIAIVSPRFGNGTSVKKLKEQDGLFHVCLEGVENGKPKRETRLIRSVSRVIAPSVDYQEYLNIVVSPELRFVISNTTEAGIHYEREDVTADIPTTFPGKVAGLLWKRFQHYNGDRSKGLIFLCCELIEDNGQRLKEYVLRHAKENRLPESFTEWVEEGCVFCDTLVDRIVSGFPSDSIESIKEETGFDDDMVVKGEFYHSWAIGGAGYEEVRKELPLDRASMNVMFMPSVKSYREQKVRILNGSHTGMVPIGILLNHVTVYDAFTDKSLNKFINDMVDREVLPMIDSEPAELKKFADSILERFLNPYNHHKLSSIALNSLSKWEVRNFPTVKDYWEKRGEVAAHELFTFAALLALYAPESGFTPDDNPEHVELIKKILESSNDVESIVNSGIFNENFEKAVPGFSKRATEYLSEIRSKGMEKALENFNSEQ